MHSLVTDYDKTRSTYTKEDIPDTQYLVADVGRRARVPHRPPAPAMTSLVQTSTWISRKPSLAARHGLEGAMWCRTAARLRNSLRHRLDSWLVSVHLAHTKQVAGHPSPGAAGPAASTLTRLAMIATAISKRVETDHMSQTWNNTVCTRCGPDPELYWFIHVQQGQDVPKRNQNIFAAEARVTMGKP